jgi:clan AA aspartic protease
LVIIVFPHLAICRQVYYITVKERQSIHPRISKKNLYEIKISFIISLPINATSALFFFLLLGYTYELETENMSVVYTELTLKNEIDSAFAKRGYIKADEIRQTIVQAIVDTGAWTIVINNETREKLGLDDKGLGEATLADGQKAGYPMAGPLEIWWKNRHLVCEALVIPDAPDILLGAWVLEGLDLTINPKRELVGVHGDIVMHRV